MFTYLSFTIKGALWSTFSDFQPKRNKKERVVESGHTQGLYRVPYNLRPTHSFSLAHQMMHHIVPQIITTHMLKINSNRKSLF
jgi:hypothetical protein